MGPISGLSKKYPDFSKIMSGILDPRILTFRKSALFQVLWIFKNSDQNQDILQIFHRWNDTTCDFAKNFQSAFKIDPTFKLTLFWV